MVNINVINTINTLIFLGIVKEKIWIKKYKNLLKINVDSDSIIKNVNKKHIKS